MIASSFVRIGPDDLYPLFDPARQPSLDDHWTEGTKMFTAEARRAEREWHLDVDRWSIARALYAAHRSPSVPPEYADRYEMIAQAHLWVQEMAQGATPNVLVLYGSVGTGKTTSAVAAACLIQALTAHENRFHVPGPGVQFYLATKLLREMKNFGNREAHEETLWKVTRAKTLILDDLTRPKTSDFDHESITEILDERRGRLPTIVTSNANTEDELEASYGDHLASRLIGGSTVVKIMGLDRRRS